MYQFPDRAALDRATSGEHSKRPVADFNRDWSRREALTGDFGFG